MAESIKVDYVRYLPHLDQWACAGSILVGNDYIKFTGRANWSSGGTRMWFDSGEPAEAEVRRAVVKVVREAIDAAKVKEKA